MRRRRVRRVILLLGLLAGYFWIVKNTGAGVPCPFQYFFGLKCPGCGITRMVMALSAGAFKEAFLWNPAIFLWSPFLVWVLARQLRGYVEESGPVWKRWEQIGLYLFLIFLLVFGVIRNLPGAPFP